MSNPSKSTKTEKWLSVKNMNQLSASEYVLHHNQRLMAERLDAQEAALTTFVTGSSCRRGSTASVESQELDTARTETIEKLEAEEFQGLIRDQMGVFQDNGGKILTRTSKTSKEAAKSFKDSLLKNIDDDEHPVTKLLQQLDESGIEQFYVRAGKAYTADTKVTTAGSKRARR